MTSHAVQGPSRRRPWQNLIYNHNAGIGAQLGAQNDIIRVSLAYDKYDDTDCLRFHSCESRKKSTRFKQLSQRHASLGIHMCPNTRHNIFNQRVSAPGKIIKQIDHYAKRDQGMILQ